MFRLGLLVAVALAIAAIPASAGATPPAPCNNAPQITDAVNNDGHHPGTNLTGGWWSEASGHLQAVIQVYSGVWVAEHDDAEINGSAFAVVFSAGAKTWYLRAKAPAQDHAQDPVTFDYGTYTSPGAFTSLGTTTGTVEKSSSTGTATIDVPAAVGAVAGTRLTNLYIVTYDGINGGEPTWVDHAPGGEEPTDPARGADYVVGSCGGGGGGGTPQPGATPDPGTGATPGAVTTTSVQLNAPARVTGRKTVTITGRVFPARGGVAVTLTRKGRTTTVSHTLSAADGTFRITVAIGETTRLRAAAEGIGSSELTVLARTTVKIKIRRRADGSTIVTGTVDPKLPGRVLWLRTNAVTPAARTTTRNGTFTLRIKHPRPGRYEAVVIPDGERAERATSNTGVIR